MIETTLLRMVLLLWHFSQHHFLLESDILGGGLLTGLILMMFQFIPHPQQFSQYLILPSQVLQVHDYVL